VEAARTASAERSFWTAITFLDAYLPDSEKDHQARPIVVIEASRDTDVAAVRPRRAISPCAANVATVQVTTHDPERAAAATDMRMPAREARRPAGSGDRRPRPPGAAVIICQALTSGFIERGTTFVLLDWTLQNEMHRVPSGSAPASVFSNRGSAPCSAPASTTSRYSFGASGRATSMPE
jgi:hypothetical protein